MGTPSIYGSFSFVTELDCDWATMDIRIFYTNHSEGVDLDKLEMVGNRSWMSLVLIRLYF